MGNVEAPAPAEKPLLRGVLHQGAALLALVAGVVMAAGAPSTRGTWASLGFTASLVLLYGVSATYHRVHWSQAQRAWMRRADHASIFVLIAGTYTPIAVMALPPGLGVRLLAAVWIGAIIGVLQTLLWIKAPKIIPVILCVALGWCVVWYWNDVVSHLTMSQLGLMAAGGVVYTVGALCYAVKRPNPVPGVFGYHEVFHLCTVVAATMHFVAIYSIIHGNP